MNSDILHFGIVSDGSVPEDRWLPAGFISDGDSFMNWGDPGPDGRQRDMTLHVIKVVPETDMDSIDAIQHIKRRIDWERESLSKALGPNERLADYVVITDADDWGERVRVWLIDGSISS